LPDLIIEVPESAEMEALGGKVARHCPPGFKLYLQGELGAGKTTFVRGFLRQFGYKGAVKSPTYTLVEPYSFVEKPVYHFDLYRLNSPEELEHIGWRDYFGSTAICLVEWPEKAGSRLVQPDLLVRIEFPEIGRKLVFEAKSSPGKALLQSLK